MASKTGRSSDQFILRFPEGMRERISLYAKDNGRSMNAEIIHRMESSFLMGEEIIHGEGFDPEEYAAYTETEEYKNKLNADTLLRLIFDVISLSLNIKRDDNLFCVNLGQIYKPLHDYIYKEFGVNDAEKNK